MATYLPGSGALSLNDIDTLFSLGKNLNSYRGTTYYTSSSGPFTFPSTSSAISISSFYGTGPTANRVAINYTFTSNTADASLNVTSISGYSAGHSDITIYVNSGVYLWASSTGNAALSLLGGTSGDTLTLVNNGYIIGCGGTGGNALLVSPSGSGNNGGNALSISFPIIINNTYASAYIAGGGGGGAASGHGNGKFGDVAAGSGGGGAGGGQGGAYASSGVTGGAGGSVGSVGGDGSEIISGNLTVGSPDSGKGGGAGGGGSGYGAASGGGGGRVLPGTGGEGGHSGGNPIAAGTGGSGNSVGGDYISSGGGGGGGWGASGGNASNGKNQSGSQTYYAGTPGLGGKAVALNGNSVTWVSGDTSRVYGAIS